MDTSLRNSKWLCLTCVAMASLITACSGAAGTGGGNGGGSGGTDDIGGSGVGGGALPPPKPNSLTRIPDHELKCDDPSAVSLPPTPFARLTNVQYANAVNELIAPVTIDNALTKLKAEQFFEGFTTNADSQSTVAELIESFEKVGAVVGDAVTQGLPQLSTKLKITACPPKSDAASKTACGAAFVDAFGTKAFRRPLFDEERTRYKKLFDDSSAKWSFEDGISVVASAIVQAPQFVYKIETEGSKGPNGNLKLTAWELASRLSFLIWNTLPDDSLVEAAKKGDLAPEKIDNVLSQAKRMLGDARAQAASKEFLGQWYQSGKLANGLGTKDANAFKTYTPAVAKALMDGLDAFVADTLLGPDGSFSKLFSSTDGWVTKDTAAIYGVPAPSGTGLTKVSLNESQRRGFLTQPAIMAGLAHGNYQSPVQRGVFIMSELMCQPPGAPPPGVNRGLFDPPAAAAKETNRQLTARVLKGQPGQCQSCHNIINPIGYMFENYNAIGQWQDQENTLSVDASGKISDSFDLDGDFKNAVELAAKFSKSEQAQQCFVQAYYRYNLGRSLDDADGCSIASITDQVVESKGSYQTMVLSFVKSNSFLYRSPIVQ